MNEIRTGSSIRQALDESTARLPWKITHRLEVARRQALERVPSTEPALQLAGVGPSSLRIVVGGSAGTRARSVSDAGSEHLSGDAPYSGWRAALVAASVAVLIAGWIGVSHLEAARDAEELDELESALLDDDVPIRGLADRGFGAFLRGVAPAER